MYRIRLRGVKDRGFPFCPNAVCMCNACAEFLLNPNSKHATISTKSRVFPTLNPKHDEDEADGQVAEVEGFWHSVRQGGSEFRVGFRDSGLVGVLGGSGRLS